MTEINVEKIMEEIRQEIREKGVEEILPEFSETTMGGFSAPVLNMQEMLGDLQSASENYFVDPARPLGGGLTVSPQKRGWTGLRFLSTSPARRTTGTGVVERAPRDEFLSTSSARRTTHQRG